MKKLNLMALLVGAVLFTGVGATTLSASDMKCGAGKCGNAMNKSAKKDTKEAGKTCDSCADKKAMKCGSGKCGDAKKAPEKAMKCGAGKCGNVK